MLARQLGSVKGSKQHDAAAQTSAQRVAEKVHIAARSFAGGGSTIGALDGGEDGALDIDLVGALLGWGETDALVGALVGPGVVVAVVVVDCCSSKVSVGAQYGAYPRHVSSKYW